MNERKRIELMATFFYLGRVPIMPGTFGTLGAIPLVMLLHLTGTYGYLVCTFILSLIAVKVADLYEYAVQDHDTKEVVIDEVVGFLMTMFWLPMTWRSFAVGFLLFRILDIIKPFPINMVDRSVQGGFGTVADDLVAGVIANIILQLVYTQTNWLGVQFTF